MKPEGLKEMIARGAESQFRGELGGYFKAVDDDRKVAEMLRQMDDGTKPFVDALGWLIDNYGGYGYDLEASSLPDTRFRSQSSLFRLETVDDHSSVFVYIDSDCTDPGADGRTKFVAQFCLGAVIEDGEFQKYGLGAIEGLRQLGCTTDGRPVYGQYAHAEALDILGGNPRDSLGVSAVAELERRQVTTLDNIRDTIQMIQNSLADGSNQHASKIIPDELINAVAPIQ